MKLGPADKLWMKIFQARGVTLSKEWAKDEIDRCREDHKYFIDHYCLIRNRTEDGMILPPKSVVYDDVIDIKLYDIQGVYLDSVNDNQNTAVVKTRQSGISLTTGLYVLKRATFENNKEFIVISKSERESIKFLDELKFSHMYLPFFLRRPKNGNMKKLVLGGEYNSSVIRALPGGKDAGRSYTATLLVLDETAFIEHADNIWSAASPTLTTTGGKAILISTPWEDEGLFFDVVEGARDEINDFKLVEVPWRAIPNRDEAWYAKECARLQHVEEKIKTELDMQFITRGVAFFSMDKIKELPLAAPLVNIINETADLVDPNYHNIEISDFYSGVSLPLLGKGHIYEFPKKEAVYIIGHDPAEDGTSSCHGTVIFQVDGFPQVHPRVVAEFRSKSIVMDSLIDMSVYYNNAKIVIEKNRGFAVIMHFASLDRDDLIITRPNGEPGIVTTTASRQILLKLLNKFFCSDVDSIPLILYEEAKEFRRNSAGKLKGKKYDDLLFGAGIALLGLATLPERILDMTGVSKDERLALLASLRDLTTDKRIPASTADRYMAQLKEDLFGQYKQPVDTNRTKDIMKKYEHMLPR